MLPEAEEGIRHGVPAFQDSSRTFVSFGAGKDHSAFYPGPEPIENLARELARFDTSRGAIRFTADEPLPASLARRIVQARLVERRASVKQPVRAPGRE